MGGNPLKNISIKNAVSLYFNAKDKYFCNQLRKTFLFTLIKCLIAVSLLDRFNFALLLIFLANNGQSLGNILRHYLRPHYNDPILKEAAAFKLNTLSGLKSRTCPLHLT